ncbi:hypothetical protein D3C81_1262440 [compost metagenome]
MLIGADAGEIKDSDRPVAEALLTRISSELSDGPQSGHASVVANRAHLLIALGRPLDALQSIESQRRRQPGKILETVAIVAYAKLGATDKALSVLEAAVGEFGEDDRLLALKAQIKSGAISVQVTHAASIDHSIGQLREAMQRVIELTPTQIGNLFGPDGSGIRGYLMRQVARAVSALGQMKAVLRQTKSKRIGLNFENDLNTSVRVLLGALLSFHKWDVADQSLGSSTTAGNPGERDAVVRVSGQEVAIYEALVCLSVDRSQIRSHFHRLIAYGACDIYFLVIYSYVARPKVLLDYVKEMLEGEAPAVLEFTGCDSIGPPDFEVSGFFATYQCEEHREVAVVCFVVDLKPQAS